MDIISFYRVERWLFERHIPVLPKIVQLLIFLIFNSKITADSKGNVCEISTPGFIIVRPAIILADGTKVIPDQTVKRNTRKDEIVTNSRDD